MRLTTMSDSGRTRPCLAERSGANRAPRGDLGVADCLFTGGPALESAHAGGEHQGLTSSPSFIVLWERILSLPPPCDSCQSITLVCDEFKKSFYFEGATSLLDVPS